MAQIVLGDIDLIGGIDRGKSSGQEGHGRLPSWWRFTPTNAVDRWSDRSIGFAAVCSGRACKPPVPGTPSTPWAGGRGHEIHVCGSDRHDGSHMGERSHACQGLHCQVTWWTGTWVVEPSLCGVGGCRRHRDAGEGAAAGDLGEHSSLRRARNGQEGRQERSRQRHGHQGKGSSSLGVVAIRDPAKLDRVAPSHEPTHLSTSARPGLRQSASLAASTPVFDRDISGDESETKFGA